MKCCSLKAVPDGIWECPRHRCKTCGSGPAQTDALGNPRCPDPPGDAASTLWPCRTCPNTYCERCLPDEVHFAGTEIVCEGCQEKLTADMSDLQVVARPPGHVFHLHHRALSLSSLLFPALARTLSRLPASAT